MSLVQMNDLLNALAEVCEEKNLKAAISGSLKGGLLTGCSAVVGGLLLGPVGLAIGGAIGGTASALSAKREFKPVAVIIMEMPSKQREKLFNRIMYAFRHITATDVSKLLFLIMTNGSIKERAIEEIKKFLESNMSMTVR